MGEDISFEKFGLKFRVVEKSDAQRIVAWRTHSERNRYISPIEEDVEKQRQWIQRYKEREKRGDEYYFVVKDRFGEEFGFIRVYQSSEEHIEVGSWVSRPDYTKGWNIFKILLAAQWFVFEKMGRDSVVFRIHRENTPVLKVCAVFADKAYKEEDGFLFFMSAKGHVSPGLARLYRRFDK